MLEYWYTESGGLHDIVSNDWSRSGGSNKNDALLVGGGRPGPPTHDDDTSYIVANGDGGAIKYQDANIDWPGPILALPGGGTFTAYFRHRMQNGTPNRVFVFRNSSGTFGASAVASVTDANSSYANSGTATVTGSHRPGGSSWVVADFDDTTPIVNACFYMSTTAVGYGTRVTSVWGQLEYIPPGGAWTQILGLGPLMLAATRAVGTLVDQVQFRQYLEWWRAHSRRHTILRAHEVAEAWREVRAYRYPRFLEVGV